MIYHVVITEIATSSQSCLCGDQIMVFPPSNTSSKVLCVKLATRYTGKEDTVQVELTDIQLLTTLDVVYICSHLSMMTWQSAHEDINKLNRCVIMLLQILCYFKHADQHTTHHIIQPFKLLVNPVFNS